MSDAPHAPDDTTDPPEFAGRLDNGCGCFVGWVLLLSVLAIGKTVCAALGLPTWLGILAWLLLAVPVLAVTSLLFDYMCYCLEVLCWKVGRGRSGRGQK